MPDDTPLGTTGPDCDEPETAGQVTRTDHPDGSHELTDAANGLVLDYDSDGNLTSIRTVPTNTNIHVRKSDDG
jgi:YD repeat-containing protein